MSSCSLCSGTIEKFHGEKKHQHITLSQRLYIFANRNKQTISLCTIAIIVAVILILKNKRK
jgi:ascorbate-specific PTS system EIIC-type component UlaA